jgi:hypothetical protein
MPSAIVSQIYQVLEENSMAQARAHMEFKTNLNKPEVPEPTTAEPVISIPNLAVERCNRAWKRTYKTAKAARKDNHDSEKLAKEAYRKAMPMLDSHENIRDFIACTTYAVLLNVIMEDVGTKLLYAAQVASGALRNIPKQTKPVNDAAMSI